MALPQGMNKGREGRHQSLQLTKRLASGFRGLVHSHIARIYQNGQGPKRNFQSSPVTLTLAVDAAQRRRNE